MRQVICWFIALGLLALIEFAPLTPGAQIVLLAIALLVGPLILLLPAILERQVEARRRAAGGSGEVPRIDLVSESGWWRWILAALAGVWLVEPWLAFRLKRQPEEKGRAS